MSNLWKAFLASPILLGAAFAGSAVAAETVETVSVDALSNPESIQLAQVTSVSELSDVLPSDWAYTALQRLVEEYGCLEGYPDRSFRGNRALTRYEFAAGLNACLDVIVQLIGGGDDLDTIRRLQEEFAAELATIRGRVDTLEADVAELEANQFSTTTKLKGQLDAHLVVPFDSDINNPLPGGDDDEDISFQYRARLNFDTSFTGEDRLRLRLQAGSDPSDDIDTTGTGVDFAGATNVPGGLSSSGSGGLNNNLRLDDVYYSFPIGNRVSAIVAANSIVTDDFVTSTIVPFDGPSVADYGGPMFYDVFAGGEFAVGFNVALTDSLVLDLGYSVVGSDDSLEGIFGDNNSYIAQLNFLSDGIIDAAVTYIGTDQNGVDDVIAGLLSLDFGGFEVGGYYADQDGDESFQFGAAFGSFGAYYVQDFNDDEVIEGYYNAEINKYWTLTPAVIYGNPNGGNNDALYGVVRSTFSF